MMEREDNHRNSALLNIDPLSLNLLNWSRREVSKYEVIGFNSIQFIALYKNIIINFLESAFRVAGF